MSETIDQLVSIANPFPGLRPFKIEESHLFFGREGQSDEVLLKLSKNRFIGVIGPSGSGKSSFIYCGVMPILYGGFLTDASPDWEVVVTRPGAGPIDNLAESLLKNNPEYIQADAEEKKIKRTIFSTLLRSSSLGLVEAVEQSRKKKDVNYLILVDQFEELFRFKDSHHDNNSVNETLAFVNLLIEAVNYPDAPIYVAITMRSDFIGDCAQFPELTRKINDSHYLIPQLTRDQKRRAIEGPVAVGGAKISARLTQQLLNDLGDNPDQLPILQHSLMRTWSYWGRYKDFEEEPVDLKHYEAIGTMTEALSMHANEAYDELTEDQKRICEILFKAITEKRGENFGIRRPTKLNEIAAIADVSEEEIGAVIEKFREPGRSLLTPAHGNALTGKSMIDISHESLMRIWVRLKNWVDDEADAVQMYIRLAEAASMYQVGKAGLWRPPDLQLALNWQAKHKPTLVWGQRYNPAFERTMIFLEYSKKEWETEQRIKELEQKRKLQRARIVALVLSAATFISIIFLVFAFIQKAQADEARELAVANAAEATKQTAIAKENLALAEVQRKAAEEQRKAAEAAKEEADRQRILADQNAEKARQQEALAKENAIRAEQQAELAKKNEKIANEQKLAAQKAREEAVARQYIATAKAMAIKSREIPDPILEALMAQQAFIFNDKYDGYKYDDAIYNGLHEALEKFAHPLTLNLEGHDKGSARSLVIHMASKKLYSGGSDGRILRWTYNGKQWVMEELVGARSTYPVYSVAVNADGTMLAAGGLHFGDATNNYLEVYDLRNAGSAPKQISGFMYDIEDVHFSADGKSLYARDNAGHSIRYSDLSTSKEIVNSKEKINNLTLNKAGTILAAAGDAGTLFFYDVRNNYAVTEVYKNPADSRGHAVGLSAVGFTNDGKSIVIGDQNGIVKILPVDYKPGGRISNTLSGHISGIEQIAFANTSNFMATASDDKTVRLWNLGSLREQPIVLSGHSDWVRTAVFSADDEQLLAGMHSNAEKSKETIHAWPTKIETISGLLCQYLDRNMTEEEWAIYVGDLAKEVTCPDVEKKAKK
jgi:energy-coupling factor transporter ATP-binding protein EcfA2